MYGPQTYYFSKNLRTPDVECLPYCVHMPIWSLRWKLSQAYLPLPKKCKPHIDDVGIYLRKSEALMLLFSTTKRLPSKTHLNIHSQKLRDSWHFSLSICQQSPHGHDGYGVPISSQKARADRLTSKTRSGELVKNKQKAALVVREMGTLTRILHAPLNTGLYSYWSWMFNSRRHHCLVLMKFYTSSFGRVCFVFGLNYQHRRVTLWPMVDNIGHRESDCRPSLPRM